ATAFGRLEGTATVCTAHRVVAWPFGRRSGYILTKFHCDENSDGKGCIQTTDLTTRNRRQEPTSPEAGGVKHKRSMPEFDGLHFSQILGPRFESPLGVCG